jgi:hypothetical protein
MTTVGDKARGLLAVAAALSGLLSISISPAAASRIACTLVRCWLTAGAAREVMVGLMLLSRGILKPEE